MPSRFRKQTVQGAGDASAERGDPSSRVELSPSFKTWVLINTCTVHLKSKLNYCLNTAIKKVKGEGSLRIMFSVTRSTRAPAVGVMDAPAEKDEQSPTRVPQSWTPQREATAGGPKGIGWDFIWED